MYYVIKQGGAFINEHGYVITGSRVSRPQRLGVLPFGDLSVILSDRHGLRYLQLNNPLNSECKFCIALKRKTGNIKSCSKGNYVVHLLLPLPPDVKDEEEGEDEEEEEEKTILLRCLSAATRARELCHIVTERVWDGAGGGRCIRHRNAPCLARLPLRTINGRDYRYCTVLLQRLPGI